MRSQQEPLDNEAHDTSRRMALAREWDELVEQVRMLDGFEDFLRPLSADQLLPAAQFGPIVVVNVSQSRCDALLVTTHGIDTVPLPDLTAGDVTERTTEYLRCLAAVDDARRLPYTARQANDVSGHPPHADVAYVSAKTATQVARSRERMLRAVLEWLWDAIAEPILSSLDIPGSDDDPTRHGPRLWWCPTGLLTLLPLHAAGHYDRDTQVRATVMDRVVSSYTPTISALIAARNAPTNSDDPEMTSGESTNASQVGKILVVSVADIPGQVPLGNVAADRQLLTELFPNNHTLLDGNDASRAHVLEQMSRHPWAHFSCHGHQNLTDPSQGGLLLHDGMLTVADISAGQYHGDFAFLAACKTALGGNQLPDEAITLAAALHYTGYRHVLASLWSIPDLTAAQVARDIYRSLTIDGTLNPDQSAYALHSAVKRLRDSGQPLHVWTPFTHTGP